jgi:hypothetical protein
MGNPLVPAAAATNETNEKMAGDKFIAWVFLAGVDVGRTYTGRTLSLHYYYLAFVVLTSY